MTTHFNPNSTYGQHITRGKVPKLASMLSVPLAFTIDAQIKVSINVLRGIPNVSGIDGIQSLFIDNSNNGSTTSLIFDNGPSYVCPAYAQATFPIFFSGEVLHFTANSTGNVLVNLYFLNTKE